WRAAYLGRKARARLPLLFDQDPSGLTGLRALVLMQQDDGILNQWSAAMTDVNHVAALLQYLNSASRMNWFVLLRQIAPRLLKSVATDVLSVASGSHLRILNILLTPEHRQDVGHTFQESTTLYLLQCGLYNTLVDAMLTMSLRVLTQLLTSPLRTLSSPISSSSYLHCLSFIYTHILTIPLLPNRLQSLALIIQLNHDLALPLRDLHCLRPFSPMIMLIPTHSSIHLLANLAHFIIPKFGIAGLSLFSYDTYLCFLVALVPLIPESMLCTSDEKNSWLIDSLVAGEGIEIDLRTRKRVSTLFSCSFISTLVNHAHASASIPLVQYLPHIYLYWPSQWDEIEFGTVMMQNGAGPLVVELLYRTGVHESPLG
ncbi:hypothetical protein C8J57DRAFT_987446, partial [Mycena rebaudengoi]